MGCGSSQLDQTQYSKPISEKKQGETSIYRNSNSLKALVEETIDNCKTLQQQYLTSVKKFGSRPFLGTRQQNFNIQNPDSAYTFKTYNDIKNEADAIGTAIDILNLAPELREYKEFRLRLIGIFAKNREEWIVLDFANAIFNYTMIPFYDTLGPASISYILENSNITTIFCSLQGCQTILKMDNLVKLQNIVLLEDSTNNTITEELKQQFQQKNLKLYTWQQLLSTGREALLKKPIKNDSDYPKVVPEDCYTFSYTSGTTGNPKGVMLTHKNMCSMLGTVPHTSLEMSSEDVHLSFLPLPHIYERLVINVFIQYGARICFYGGDVQKLKEDILLVRPTILFGVPRILNRFYDAINTQLQSQQGCKKSLINSALNSKKQNMKFAKYTHSFYDSIVFKKTKAALGGRVRLIVNGSAPLSSKIQEFLRIVFCCPLLDGYGQTESTAASFGSMKQDPNSGTCGGPSTCTEFKLVDVPEMNYTSEDKDIQGKPLPRGEICMRGGSIFIGYYKEEEKTKEAIDEDGWLHTGDIGQINMNGTIKIIDRKKNIFKLQQGEYVAPEKIENIYVRAKGVQEIFLHGDSLQTYCVAIVVPNQPVFEAIAKDNNISGTYEELCSNQQMNKIILDNMTAHGKNEGLLGFEQAKVIYIEPKSFLLHGCLTTTMKIQRHMCKQLFKQQLSDMYKPEIIAKIEKK